MKIIDGNKISEEIIDGLKKRGAPEEFFAAVIIGDNPASVKFVELKKKIAESIGVELKVFKAQDSTSVNDIRTMMEYLASDPECGGLMVQMPLPKGVDKDELLKLIPKEKDADALRGNGGVLSPAVLTVEEILKREEIDISNETVAVIGVGFLVGGPVSEWLKPRCKKLILIDKNDDIYDVREADVVILGAGKRGLVNAAALKDNSLVIDFGCSMTDEGNVCGDLDILGAEERDIKYTPTPGGTGPILIAKLFENFYKLNKK